jgi:hypothetical protein
LGSNTRRTKSEKFVENLAKSIQAIGLLRNIQLIQNTQNREITFRKIFDDVAGNVNGT